MPLTVEEFTQRLTSSGVMSADELRDWIAAVPVEKRPGDGEALARELVRQQRLTKFQAEQLYAGKEKSLTLGNYVILDKLGQGGMGMVLKARHRRMGRIVALKVMSPAAVKSKDAVKRFHREVQTAAKLTHPNIVTAFDADEAKGTHFLVMEYVEGDDLSQLVKKHGPISVEQAIECIIQAARGLTHAHAEGVIHRDIKPANLLLDKHGVVKILDMGLARLESGLSDAAGVAGAGLTQSGTIMGTVDYMSPEQAEDTRHADARADIYSLGCSLFYLLTGQAVYGGETMMKKLLAHRDAALPSLVDVSGTALAAGFSQGNTDPTTPVASAIPLKALDAVFHKMIAKRTVDRYQSMGEVIADLERCRAGQSVTMNVNAVSGESSSGYELQNFLRQISGEAGSQVTNATSAGPFGGASVGGTAETVFTTNNSAGTDPQTEMTLAGARPVAGGFVAELVRVRSFGALVRILTNSATGRLASVGVVLLLLGAWWMFRTPTGTLQIEIADEQIAVTLGETGCTLRGMTEETLRLPIGEHVLHVQIGETTLDTPEITVAKGEPVEIKVEKVGNRVRVMRGKEFLVAKELPRSKSGGTKVGNADPTAGVVAQFALEFDGQSSHVGLPNIGLSSVKPFTVEAWVRLSKLTDPASEGIILAGSGLILSRSAKGLWLFHVNGMRGQLSSDSAAITGEWVHLAAVWDGQSRFLYVNGQRQKEAERKTSTQGPRDFTTELVLGGLQRSTRAAAEKSLSGQLREVRISSVSRYQSEFQPAQRFASDKNTLGLYHFDEGNGDVLKDSSGNGHHGKIVGAKWVKVGEVPESNDASQWALHFDVRSNVQVPSLKMGRFDPLCVEAYVQIEKILEKDFTTGIAGFTGEFGLGHNNTSPVHVSATVYLDQSNARASHKEPIVLGQRTHLAGVRQGDEVRLYLDGKKVGSARFPVERQSNKDGFLEIGRSFQGIIDEVRVSKSHRYDQDFAPAPRFTLDPDTLALYHFDEGSGSELKDSSGNKHHGKIVGAKWVRLSEGSPAEVTPKVASGSTKREFASDEWIDVLPLIDPALDKSGVGVQWGRNDWRMEGGELRYRGDDKWGKLFFPIRYRGRSLEWELEFTRTSSGSGFTTDVPLPGGFKGISVSSDRLSFANQTPNQPFQVVNGQRMKMRFQVRHDGTNDAVDIFVNDKLALHWDGQLDKIKNAASPSELRDQSEHNGLFMAGNSDYTFHAIRVRMLNGGTAELLRPAAGSAATSPFSDAALTPYDLWTSPDYEWTKPENLGPVVNSASDEGNPCLSADGLTLLFESGRAGGQGAGDLWMCKRATLTAPWSAPENLGPKLNTNSSEVNPSLSADGLTLMFTSDRFSTVGEYRIWQSTRATTDDPWPSRKRLEAIPELAGASDSGPEQSADGLSLYFHSRGRPGSGKHDLWVCRRANTSAAWGAPENLGPTVNSVEDDTDPALSSDGRVLVFSSKRGNGKLKELWWSSRPSLDAPWSAAQQIGAPIKSAFESFPGTLSTDGQTMLFTSHDRTGGQGRADIWQTRRVLTPAAAARAAAANTFTNTLGMEFVRVPKGKSWLGGGGGKPGTQAVEFQEDFYLGKFEVTQGEWEVVMDGSKPSYFLPGAAGGELVKGMTDAERKRLPVENVSWDHAQEFLRRLNTKAKDSGWQYRLPTASEWEYAARGGPLTKPEESAFNFYLDAPINSLEVDQANVKETGMNRPRSVGSYQPNRLGLHDMHGNVREFCSDAVTGADGSPLRVARYGGFTTSSKDCWAGKQKGELPTKRLHDLGLRVARVPVGNATSFTNTLGMEFVRVPKGKSWLGGGGGKPGTQAVEFQEDFYLGKFEVTQGEWQNVMGKNPSHFSRSGVSKETVKNLSDADLQRLPVEGVSWNACQEFVTRLNERHPVPGWVYRLPTQAEWEYACRGGPLSQKEDSVFDFTLEVPTNTLAPDLARFDAFAKGTAQVGSYPPNRLGLHDMHGNVFEWCADELTPDAKGVPQRGSKGGGFWSKAVNCRTWDSYKREPSHTELNLGLRVARVPIAGQWQPLFRDKSLSGWKVNQSADAGAAEVVTEDGVPTLRLTEPVTLESPRTYGDYHLRFEYKPSAGPYGGGVHLAFAGSPQRRLSLGLGDLKRLNLMGYAATFAVAERRGDQFVPVGSRVAENQTSVLNPVPLDPATPWQRIEVLRQGDSFIVLMNGKLAGMFTGVRMLREGKEELPAERLAMIFYAFGGPGLFRNIELREINALPPEVLNQNAAAWQPLFNGKDLKGLTPTNLQINTGRAEVLPEQPHSVLRLHGPYGLNTPVFGDYHLRYECNFNSSSANVHHMDLTMGLNLGCYLEQGQPALRVQGYADAEFRKAELRGGKFVAVGDVLTDRPQLKFTKLASQPGNWQQVEIIRLGDSVVYRVHGQVAGAITEVRRKSNRQPVAARSSLELWVGGGQATADFRNIEIRDITALPPELLKQAAWQPLFNGKDVTGLTKTIPTLNTGKAEVVLEDGQPALRLTYPNGLATPAFGNYHLRLDCKTDPYGGGIHHLYGSGRGPLLRIEWQAKRTPPEVVITGVGLTFQKAELRDGRPLPIGATLKDKDSVTFSVPSLDPSGWQRVEIVRLDDAFVYSINGKLVGAVTNIRTLTDTPPKIPGHSPIEFYTTAPKSLFRNIELREINALPPEIVP